MGRKVFIEVVALHRTDGGIKPLSIIWEDGRKYEVDRIIDICQAAAGKIGGQGMRYTCSIHGKRVELFDDRGRWFMEAR